MEELDLSPEEQAIFNDLWIYAEATVSIEEFANVERAKYIGASEVGAFMELDPYTSRTRFVKMKKNEKRYHKPANFAMLNGLEMETPVLQYYVQNFEPQFCNQPPILKKSFADSSFKVPLCGDSNTLMGLVASPDCLFMSPFPLGIEIKYTTRKNAQHMFIEVPRQLKNPDHSYDSEEACKLLKVECLFICHLLQCMQNMFLTGVINWRLVYYMRESQTCVVYSLWYQSVTEMQLCYKRYKDLLHNHLFTRDIVLRVDYEKVRISLKWILPYFNMTQCSQALMQYSNPYIINGEA